MYRHIKTSELDIEGAAFEQADAHAKGLIRDIAAEIFPGGQDTTELNVIEFTEKTGRAVGSSVEMLRALLLGGPGGVEVVASIGAGIMSESLLSLFGEEGRKTARAFCKSENEKHEATAASVITSTIIQ